MIILTVECAKITAAACVTVVPWFILHRRIIGEACGRRGGALAMIDALCFCLIVGKSKIVEEGRDLERVERFGSIVSG